jgi:outer membrane protein OmpA-like peptidoglycan-associated protein
MRIAFLSVMAGTVALAQPATSGTNELRLRIGLLSGLNYNNIAAGMEKFIDPSDAPSIASLDFSRSSGLSGYGGLLFEYPGSELFGGQLRIAYDDRRTTRSVSESEMKSRLNYTAIELGLRMNLPADGLYAMIGPSAHIRNSHTYSYHPAAGEGAVTVEDGTLNNASRSAFGIWGGIGYDLPLNRGASGTRWYLTPFAESSYLFDQMNESTHSMTDQTWSTLTVRVGLGLKLERSMEPRAPDQLPAPQPAVEFRIEPPRDGMIGPHDVIEYFPLLPYVFFDSGSAAMPPRYRQLTRTQALTFNESWLPEPGEAGPGGQQETSRSTRQLGVYANTLNIVAMRMLNSPATTITLVGSAPDLDVARRMADEAKRYMVTAFPITAERITTRGEILPPHASGTRVTPKEDLPMVAEENRRVEIVTRDRDLLKPVERRALLEEPFENDLLTIVKSAVHLESCTVTIEGRGGAMVYGPFFTTRQRINATSLLGDADSGSFRATLTAFATDGNVMTRQQQFTLKRRTSPPVIGSRFSILFEFDESKTVAMYEAFLRRQVAPLIPDGAMIYVHGHTDIIGEEGYNQDLSQRRAERTEEILGDELRNLGRKTVVFDMFGFGELTVASEFSNRTPEGRHYNRTVVIDITPAP